ncbi:MAG TPA: potassium channel family protein [Baekduia sp.]|nr:potassium channel family protein [Baekduia sp.]
MDDRSQRIARRFEMPMLVAAILVVPLLILEESSVGQPWDAVATVLNWGTWLAFAAELVTMLVVVPDRGRWLRDHPVEVVATVLTPPILPAGLAAARGLRLLRVLRVLRLAPLLRATFTLDGLRYAGLLAFMTLLIGGTAFAAVEPKPDEWDGIWWAATTMTTVGYGDIGPTTDGGRVIALVVMTVGIGFATLLIGVVAERFTASDVAGSARDSEIREDEILAELRQLSARLAAIEQRLP